MTNFSVFHHRSGNSIGPFSFEEAQSFCEESGDRCDIWYHDKTFREGILVQRYPRLKLEKLNEAIRWLSGDSGFNPTATEETIRDAIEEAIELLRPYAKHLESCAFMDVSVQAQAHSVEEFEELSAPCDCGFDEVLKKLAQ